MEYPTPLDYRKRFEGDLGVFELVWRDHYHFLLQRGYRLRPRYKPGWQGSWLTNGKDIVDCEDYIHKSEKYVQDAVRVSDDVKVALKLVYTNTEEIPIGLYFSSAHLQSDKRNRCVSILDVIPVPYNDVSAFILMPFLRDFAHPVFKRKVECIEAFHQMLEGIAFMHENNVAHRDACYFNFVMDATKIIPEGFHLCQTKTYDGVRWITDYKSRKAVGPIKYYWIDFGLSSRFLNFEQREFVYGCAGQEKCVPELSHVVPYDPFKVDIFQVGMTMKRVCMNLRQEYEGLDFMWPFIDYLTQQDPYFRPSASEAMSEFERLIKPLGRGKLNGFVVHDILVNKSGKRSRLRRKKISAWKKRKVANMLTWIRNGPKVVLRRRGRCMHNDIEKVVSPKSIRETELQKCSMQAL